VRDENKKIQKIQIGDFIEREIRASSKVQYMEDKDTTYAECAKYYEIPSCDEDGNVWWKRIEAVTRHPVINEDGSNTMLKVTTCQEREVIVTKAKSLLKLINGKIIEASGASLKMGDYLPVSLKQIDFDEFRPKVVRLEWINLTEFEQESILKKFDSVNYKYEINGQDIVGLPNEFYEQMFEVTQQVSTTPSINVTTENSQYNNDPKVTLVTGLWDIGRENLVGGWSRTFQHYIDKLKQLLMVEENLIIFGDSELQKIVFEIRNQDNTQFVLRDLSWFKKNDYYNKIQ
jgi:hypothetical protein